MTAAHRASAADKQAITKKLVTLLKKRFRTKPTQSDRSVLDTILVAICLENSSAAKADAAIERLLDSFHDFNEMRVSSITELAAALGQLEQPELRGLRVRNSLQYIFERQFAFEFEILRKKTLDQAQRQLQKIKDLSAFVRHYTLQQSLGSHLIPLDDLGARAVEWLGLIEPGESPEHGAESLKSVVRKADAPLFCHLLRCLATEPAYRKAFEIDVAKAAEEGFDPFTAPERLTQLFKQPKRRAPRKKATTSKSGSAAPKKKSAAKAARTTARRTVAKKK